MVSTWLVDFFYNRKKGWVDGTTHFVDLLKSYCKTDATVMDLGAGSGEAKPNYYSLKGAARFVVGLDVDLDISKNRVVDCGVVGNTYSLPFKDGSFDFVYADYLLEHLYNPDAFIQEIRRTLRKGGYFIFRTPNRYHYVPFIARIIPVCFKSFLANIVRNIDREHKTFPVVYRLNTSSCLEGILNKNGFSMEHLELIEKEPSYLMFNTFAFLLGVLYERVVNSTEVLKVFRSNIIGVFRKKIVYCAKTIVREI